MDDRDQLGICNSFRTIIVKHGKGDRILRETTKRTFYKAFSTGQDFKGSSSSFDELWLNCLCVVKRGVTHDSLEATKFEVLKKMIATDSRTAEKYASLCNNLKGILSTRHN